MLLMCFAFVHFFIEMRCDGVLLEYLNCTYLHNYSRLSILRVLLKLNTLEEKQNHLGLRT
jgi:hypothetical protein